MSYSRIPDYLKDITLLPRKTSPFCKMFGDLAIIENQMGQFLHGNARVGKVKLLSTRRRNYEW